MPLLGPTRSLQPFDHFPSGPCGMVSLWDAHQQGASLRGPEIQRLRTLERKTNSCCSPSPSTPPGSLHGPPRIRLGRPHALESEAAWKGTAFFADHTKISACRAARERTELRIGRDSHRGRSITEIHMRGAFWFPSGSLLSFTPDRKFWRRTGVKQLHLELLSLQSNPRTVRARG